MNIVILTGGAKYNGHHPQEDPFSRGMETHDAVIPQDFIWKLFDLRELNDPTPGPGKSPSKRPKKGSRCSVREVGTPKP